MCKIGKQHLHVLGKLWNFLRSWVTLCFRCLPLGLVIGVSWITLKTYVRLDVKNGVLHIARALQNSCLVQTWKSKVSKVHNVVGNLTQKLGLIRHPFGDISRVKASFQSTTRAHSSYLHICTGSSFTLPCGQIDMFLDSSCKNQHHIQYFVSINCG